MSSIKRRFGFRQHGPLWRIEDDLTGCTFGDFWSADDASAFACRIVEADPPEYERLRAEHPPGPILPNLDGPMDRFEALVLSTCIIGTLHNLTVALEVGEGIEAAVLRARALLDAFAVS